MKKLKPFLCSLRDLSAALAAVALVSPEATAQLTAARTALNSKIDEIDGARDGEDDAQLVSALTAVQAPVVALCGLLRADVEALPARVAQEIKTRIERKELVEMTALNGLVETEVTARVTKGDLLTKTAHEAAVGQARTDAAKATETALGRKFGRREAVTTCQLPLPDDATLALEDAAWDARLTGAKTHFAKITTAGIALNSAVGQVLVPKVWAEPAAFAESLTLATGERKAAGGGGDLHRGAGGGGGAAGGLVLKSA